MARSPIRRQPDDTDIPITIRPSGSADSDAIAYCNAPDAVIVSWARNEWCALAVSDDGSYGYDSAWSQAEAEAKALSYCTGHAHIEVIVYAGSD